MSDILDDIDLLSDNNVINDDEVNSKVNLNDSVNDNSNGSINSDTVEDDVFSVDASFFDGTLDMDALLGSFVSFLVDMLYTTIKHSFLYSNLSQREKILNVFHLSTYTLLDIFHRVDGKIDSVLLEYFADINTSVIVTLLDKINSGDL